MDSQLFKIESGSIGEAMKYKFYVTYSPLEFVRACELMKKLDFDFEGVALMYTLEFSSKKIITIEEIQADIKMSFEQDGTKVWKIEGGSIE